MQELAIARVFAERGGISVRVETTDAIGADFEVYSEAVELLHGLRFSWGYAEGKTLEVALLEEDGRPALRLWMHPNVYAKVLPRRARKGLYYNNDGFVFGEPHPGARRANTYLFTFDGKLVSRDKHIPPYRNLVYVRFAFGRGHELRIDCKAGIPSLYTVYMPSVGYASVFAASAP